MMNRNTNLLLVLVLGASTFVATSAVAQTATQPAPAAPNAPAPAKPSEPVGPGVKDAGHPAVNEVNQREMNQSKRIYQEYKSGQISGKQAHQLYKNDQRVMNQEGKDMAANGGHLTKQESRQLNHELNQNSKKINKAKNGQ
ncbi:MAG TPA: hypothetical protein VEG68_10705 [Terriglobales bacterium]|nr:hypothetical protein [Terriglobales bacterium]